MKLTSRARHAVSPSTSTSPSGSARIEPRRPVDLTVRPGGNRLGELLVAAGLATPEQVVAALTESQRTPRFLGECLLDNGLLTERDLTIVVARQRGLDLVDLREVTPSPAAVALLTEAQARDLMVIPLSARPEAAEVAVAIPVDGLPALLADVIGRPVRMRLAARSDVMRAIGNSYRALTGVASEVRAFESTHTSRPEAAGGETGTDDAPVVRVVQL